MVVKSIIKAGVKGGAKRTVKASAKAALDVAPKVVDELAPDWSWLYKNLNKSDSLAIDEISKRHNLDVDDPDFSTPGLSTSVKRSFDNSIGSDFSTLKFSDRAERLESLLSDETILNDIINEHSNLTVPPQRDPIEALRANYAPRDPEEAIESLRGIGGQTKWGKTERTIQGPVPPRLADKTFKQGAESWEEAVMAGTTKFNQGDDPFQVRNFAAAYAPRGQTTKVGTRKTTGRGITKEGNTRKINEALATADWITPEETKEFGRLMAEAASEGMDGDHIIEVARVANAVRDMSPERRTAYFRIMENSGTHLGNHPKNIQKLSKELNQVVKPAEIRALDNALRNMDKRGKTLLEDIIFTPKTEPNWTGVAKKAIDGQIGKSGWDEARWRSANTQFTWSEADNRGYIDIIKDATGDDAVRTLKAQFFKEIDNLPSGTTWTLEADTAQKYRIYKRMFRDDPRFTPGGDKKLLESRGIDHFVLTIP